MQIENSCSPAPESSRAKRLRAAWLIGLVLWTAFVIAALWWLLQGPGATSSPVVLHGGDLSQLSFAQRLRDWLRLAHANFVRIYPWILFAPYVVWLASRYHLERQRLWINLPILLAGCVAFVAASGAINSRTAVMSRIVVFSSHEQTIASKGPGTEVKTMKVEISQGPAGRFFKSERSNEIVSARSERGFSTGMVRQAHQDLTNWLGGPFGPPGGAGAALMKGPLPFSALATLLDLLAYGSIAGIAHAFHFYRRYQERERAALALESNLSRVRLTALQAQLQPHFLFNTLNAIATLMRRDPRAAEATLLSLSDLLRLALSQSETQEIPLREELRFLEKYLEIQRTRFGDRLRFEQHVDPGAVECLVPTLILQPLVENAIRHGIEPSESPGVVKVTARQEGSRLAISVEDNGVGFDQAAKNGTGLSNLRARLETLYGANQRMDVIASPAGGVTLRIALPWRPNQT